MRGDVHGDLGSASGADDWRDDAAGETRVGTPRGGAFVVLEDPVFDCRGPVGTDRILCVLADSLSGGSAECLRAVGPGIWLYWDVCGGV